MDEILKLYKFQSTWNSHQNVQKLSQAHAETAKLGSKSHESSAHEISGISLLLICLEILQG